MPEADAETRSRLYNEFVALNDEYRKLADKLKPFVLTNENRVEHRQLWEIGRSLEAKLHELQEASMIRRATPRPGSGF